jgi:hypothetical protein
MAKFNQILLLTAICTAVLGSEDMDHLYDHENEVEHVEDTPKVTTAPISHIEIQTCRYCKAGHVDSVLQFIKYDAPHYGEKVLVDYSRKLPRLLITFSHGQQNFYSQ